MRTEADTYRNIILFPSDPLNPRRVDPHYAEEHAAAITVGINVAFISHDDIQAGRFEEAVTVVPTGVSAFYRGWMLTPSEYAFFEQTLKNSRDVTLNTTAEEYRQAHEAPGWIRNLHDMTPESVLVEGPNVDLLLQQAREKFKPDNGPVVLRDYSKSMKHYWDEAMFIPDVTDEVHARQVIARFLELRDDSFAGGLILRRYETFLPGEYRSWWVEGNCVMTTAHPDTPHLAPAEDWLIPDPLPNLPLVPFCTVDWALRDDGVWRVIEIGDGQVSDFPRDTDITPLLNALAGYRPSNYEVEENTE